MVARSGTVIVSWLPPDTTNGRLQSYQVTVSGRDIKVRTGVRVETPVRRNGKMGGNRPISVREGRLDVTKLSEGSR